MTEVLSALRAITPLSLAAAWLAVGLLAAVLASRSIDRPVGDGAFQRTEHACPISPQLAVRREGQPRHSWSWQADTVLALAVGVAPNNFDAMTYHLARVLHWLQNRSLAFYPTPIWRQLILGPIAEMAILHGVALSGGDWLANTVQFSAMTGSVLGVSLMAKQLGGNRTTQIFAALLAFTLPMGILQASSAQNDYVAAFWCVLFRGLHDRPGGLGGLPTAGCSSRG